MPAGRLSNASTGGGPGVPGGSITLTPQQAAFVQQQAYVQSQPVDTRPLVAKEPAVRNAEADSQLMTAAFKGEEAKIGAFVTQGAFVNMQDASGTTPLLAATEGGHLEAVKVLITNGVDVNLAKKDGTSPLLVAYKNNKKKILKELTAAAFSTLTRAMHSQGASGIAPSGYYDDEGISQIDLLQLHDETAKLVAMRTAEPIKAKRASQIEREEGGGSTQLREGSVRLLLQDLTRAAHVSEPQVSPRH